MKKTTILLAVLCSVFVGISMAVTFKMLNGSGSRSPSSQANGAPDHNMPPGMSHETHLKLMAEAAAKQQNGGQPTTSDGNKAMDHANMPAGMDHDMPAGMSHEDHLKMMAEAAAKQQNGSQPASAGGDKAADHDHANMPAGMDHNMPAGMDHATHLKMMAEATARQEKNSQPMDHSNMPAGMDHNMPAGMDHATHLKMMAEAEAKGHSHHPGQEDSPDPRPEFRAIKSLTADEIQAYQEGTGHGMAKAGEQNHYPGPRHVLDLATQLQLSPEQTRQIQKIKDSMSAAAVATGRQLIENERKLNALFAEKKIDDSQLASLVAESSSLQGKLRVIHLSAHLQTQKLLSSRQIDKYDELRGYKDTKTASADPHHDSTK